MSNYIKNNLTSIWKQTLEIIRNSEYFDIPVFNTWIASDSSLYDINDDFATIVVPLKINKQIFEDNLPFIQQKLSEVMDKKIACQVMLKSDVLVRNTNETQKIQNSIVLEDKILNKYTFENFIVGQSNRESHAAALSCAYSPGRFFNPLFIFGNSGLGKTHLLHAIGNYVKENCPDKKVLYIYSEDFITLVVNSIKDKTIEEVKEYICSVDFLLIDDIQRLAQWGRSQEIFFNLYNKLISNNKQVVITSDIHPSELKGIETRLISRFSAGLSVGIDSPEFETAYAILEKKLEGRQNESVLVEGKVLEYIATKFSSDVRRLEGALNELFFKSILYNPDIIDLKFAIEVFKENPSNKVDEEVSVIKIKKVVCEFYGLTRQQIESKSRTANISVARQIAIYLCRKHLDMPFSKIGFEFGGRDHSTIMNSFDKITRMIKEKETFATAIGKIESKLGVS